VKVMIGESSDSNEWTWTAESEVEFQPRHRRIVTFNRMEGVKWY
jgi:hypothetical protein